MYYSYSKKALSREVGGDSVLEVSGKLKYKKINRLGQCQIIGKISDSFVLFQ